MVGPWNIPEAYRDKLEHVQLKDTRTDEEILASVAKFNPVVSEKNVWAYWHSGVESMPLWNKKNVVNWVRILGPDWTVRVLDNVNGSANHALRFVPENFMPSAFVNQTMDGPYVGQHGADLVRTASIYEHGGVWLDVGIYLTRHLDQVCWNELADPSSPHNIAMPILWGTCMANYFVAGRKNDPFIYHCHRVFLEVWGSKTHLSKEIHPLLMFTVPDILSDRTDRFDIDWYDVMEGSAYASQILCFTRLFSLEDNGEGFSGIDYWRNNILAINCGEELARPEFRRSYIGFGEIAFKILQTPCIGPDAKPDSEDYKEAEDMVWDVLANGSMWKVSHAHGMTHTKFPGVILDENEGKEDQPNSFGELLRYGPLQFQQKRQGVVTFPKRDPTEIYKKGILEVF